MIEWIRKFFTGKLKYNVYSKDVEPEILIQSSIEENLNYLKDTFKESADLTVREFYIREKKAAIVTIEGMIDKETLATSVMGPILKLKGDEVVSPQREFDYIRDTVLATSEQVQTEKFSQAINLLMSGFVVFFLDGVASSIAIGIQGFEYRSISEPVSEVMQKGSREGFVEAIKINMTMIRRRVKNPSLKFESMTVGEISKTNVCLCYLTDVVSDTIISEIKKKLKSTDLKYLLAAEYLGSYLEESEDFSVFSSVGFSERPDTVCGKISEGRVAILIDGIPNAIIVPYLFVEYFQTLDDYSVRPYFATLTRWLKYLAFFVAMLLPGIYVALGTFNPEVFPNKLINKIAIAIGDTPFPLLFETLIIHFIYEIMREAGLRLPRPLGHAVSIVGALVIGETAVNSGLISAPTLMVVALTAISSYVIPNLYESNAILRFIFIIVGGSLGILGVTLLFSVILLNICAKNNFGIPFFAPVTPFNFKGMRDVAIRANWKVLSKKYEKIQNIVDNRTKDN